MIRSMTGYAATSFKGKEIKGKLSLKTLNHRYFDWFYRGPELGDLELAIRSRVQEKINRGRVEVTLEVASFNQASWEITIEEGLLNKLIQVVHALETKLGQPSPLPADFLLRIPQLMIIKRKELSAEEKEILWHALERTLDNLLKQREKEGRKMYLVLRSSLSRLRKSLNRIKKLYDQQRETWPQQIQSRVREILVEQAVNSRRLEEEVAYLLLRGDIQEEISRIEAHLDSLQETLRRPDAEPKGRQVDFLAQELLREVSTMMTKSSSLGIIQEGLTMKREIEAIRQQGQNIE